MGTSLNFPMPCQLAPLAGEEATEAMLAEFPATENDELVTKQFLRAELAEVRTESAGLRAEFAGLRAEFAELRTELKGDVAGLRNELTSEFHDRLRSQTQWIVATMIGLFGTMIAIGGLLVASGS